MTPKCLDEQHRLLLSGLIGDDQLKLISTGNYVSAALKNWLQNEITLSSSSTEKFLHSLAKIQVCNPEEENLKPHTPDIPNTGILTYLNNSGKREAMLSFFDFPIDLENPGEVLMINDDGLEWILEDPSYNQKFGARLQHCVQKGVTFRIIYPLHMDVSSSFIFSNRWLPFIMMGCVLQAYYYPRLRDKVYQRTLPGPPWLFYAFWSFRWP